MAGTNFPFTAPESAARVYDRRLMHSNDGTLRLTYTNVGVGVALVVTRFSDYLRHEWVAHQQEVGVELCS